MYQQCIFQEYMFLVTVAQLPLKKNREAAIKSQETQ